MAVLGPPGGVGEEGRPVEAPRPAGELIGEDGLGEDYTKTHISNCSFSELEG